MNSQFCTFCSHYYITSNFKILKYSKLFREKNKPLKFLTSERFAILLTCVSKRLQAVICKHICKPKYIFFCVAVVSVMHIQYQCCRPASGSVGCSMVCSKTNDEYTLARAKDQTKFAIVGGGFRGWRSGKFRQICRMCKQKQMLNTWGTWQICGCMMVAWFWVVLWWLMVAATLRLCNLKTFQIYLWCVFYKT